MNHNLNHHHHHRRDENVEPSDSDFICRFLKFMTIVTVLWLIFFFSTYEHETTLMILAVIGFILFLLYMMVQICILAFTTDPTQTSNSVIHTILTDDEERKDYHHQQQQNGDYYNDYNDDDDDDEGNTIPPEVISQRLLSYSLDETPLQIRSCLQEISSGTHESDSSSSPPPPSSPRNGRYKIICVAVYFGKQIRTEATLLLTFTKQLTSSSSSSSSNNNIARPPYYHNPRYCNGWQVTGKSSGMRERTASNSSSKYDSGIISDGFLNAKGEMYWIFGNPKWCSNHIHDEDEDDNNDDDEDNGRRNALDSCMYRGCFEFDSNRLCEGDFQAGGTAPRGRIVRMEWMDDGVAATTTTTTSNAASSQRANKTARRQKEDAFLSSSSSFFTANVEMIDLGKSLV
jgi:hypothetical protein